VVVFARRVLLEDYNLRAQERKPALGEYPRRINCQAKTLSQLGGH
jgi:hypothetical protein